jgi:hypothetical protein
MPGDVCVDNAPRSEKDEIGTFGQNSRNLDLELLGRTAGDHPLASEFVLKKHTKQQK